MQKGVQSVLPKSLEEECLKCAEIIKKFAKPEDAKVKVQLEKMSKNEILGSIIPKDIVQNAKGIAIMQIVKAGFGFSGRGGTGLVMAKLPNGEWSAPSAIGSGGIGIGWQIGAQVTDTVFILNTVEAVDAFFNPNFTLGGSLGVSAGPFGRSAELSGEVASKFAPIYSYSNSKGLFAGKSILIRRFF
jgi:lipid-binding SYLF domain-containing protein